MAKTIVKELIIILLLCLAVILILGIIFYEYVPMSKTIPNEVSYTTPEDVKQELIETGDVDESQIVMTYEVDSTDVNNYKRIQGYKPGKANPFSSYETIQSNGTNVNSTTGNNSTDGSNSGTNSNGTSNNNTNNFENATGNNNESTSGGHYFQDKGTK